MHTEVCDSSTDLSVSCCVDVGNADVIMHEHTKYMFSAGMLTDDGYV